MGMDRNAIRPSARFRGFFFLFRLLGKLLRWKALRDEGRLGTHRCGDAAPLFPELVPTPLPVRLREVPLREGVTHGFRSENDAGDPRKRRAGTVFVRCSCGLEPRRAKRVAVEISLRRN